MKIKKKWYEMDDWVESEERKVKLLEMRKLSPKVGVDYGNLQESD